jgi:predicted component of type VI protein secretion system
MSTAHKKSLGILKPIGGGDPIPLLKDEIVIGRRHSCDISLDFENISGRHCTLKFINGIWHVRDMRSTNGTFVNRQRIENDHGVLPDDELKIASHLFTIDYEPAGHLGIASTNQALEEGMAQASRSLLELAGIEVDPDERRSARHHRNGSAPSSRSLPPGDERRSRETPAAAAAPTPPQKKSHTDFPSDDLDSIEELARPLPNDDDFFNMIEGDLK